MEDMPARNACLASVRPASFSLVVQVRGRGLLFALALTGFAVALLSQLDTVEANAYERTLARRDVEDEPEDLQQGRVTKGALSSPIPRSGPKYRDERRVKCGPTSSMVPSAACFHYAMKPISLTTTPMYRFCRLIRLFGIEDHRVWVEDTLHQPDTLSWEDCYFRAENETQPPAASCDTCKVAVICEDEFHHANWPRCVTTTAGGSDVEYCYESDKANATEASKRCAQHSSTLIDIMHMDPFKRFKLARLSDTDKEYWVDIKEEDVSELSGVVSANFADIDWTSPCTTVWVGGGVPWFFVRNCSDFYRVICEPNYEIRYPYGNYISDCGASSSRYYEFCAAGGRVLNKTSAYEYCAKHSYSLLSGNHSYSLLQSTRTVPEPIIWDARSASSRKNGSNTCGAVIFRAVDPEVVIRYCSKEFGYICVKNKPRVTHGFDCEEESMALWGRRPVCVSKVGGNFPESAKECAKLGMDVLPSGLKKEEYEDIVNNYFIMYMVPRPHSALWVNVSQSESDQNCSVLSDWNNFDFHSARCEDSVGSTVCVFDNKGGHTNPDIITEDYMKL
ncbi:hypothetical protein MTO96_019222 [Rhipicephalus appendiculatus]